MPVRISFDTGNAAFDWPNGSSEAGTILRAIATSIEAGTTAGKIHDSNGNSIGTFKATFRAEGR